MRLTASREKFGIRRVLVVSQVALSLVLLGGALLFGVIAIRDAEIAVERQPVRRPKR